MPHDKTLEVRRIAIVAHPQLTEAIHLSAQIADHLEKQGVFILEEPLGGLSTSPLATARFREVSLGLRDASSAQVTGGLSETDRIVVEGNAFLEDGQAVAPRG